MNPPFTRQERIPKKYKNKLLERFSNYKKYLHGQLGYYGYFIFLADKFLTNDGRIALVLPATVLMAKSCEGVRKFLSTNYHVEYVITTHQRSAFSESVRFREMLLIAKKRKPSANEIKNLKTKIIILKKLPNTLVEARETADLLKKVIDYEDENIKVTALPYSEFMEDVENWFRYIVVNPNLLNSMKKLLESYDFVNLSEICEPRRLDLEHVKFGDFHGFILFNDKRAIKKIDAWIVDEVKNNMVVARHRSLNWKVEIPVEHLKRGLRRLSYVNSMDVSSTADYLIVSWFDDIKKMASVFLSESQLKKFNKTIVNSWENKFEKKKANVLTGRRFDISAPGTKWIAFYSDIGLVGTGGHFWCVSGITGDEAKLVTLWLNSTFALLQLIVKRKETRGAWMKVEKYILEGVKIPNISTLSAEEKQIMLKAFDEVKDVKPPSVLEQLKTRFWARVLIDKAWLQVLGYKEDADALINKLYDQLVNEIELLKKLMAEKS